MNLRSAWHKNPFARFIILAPLIYYTWYFTYESWLKPETRLDEWVVARITVHSRLLLELFGFELSDFSGMAWNQVALSGSGGVLIGAPCDGIILFALFSAFVLAFPGPLKQKIWFLPSGICAIHVINVARVAVLAVIVRWNEDWLAFNHDYTFTILTYAFVFLLWYLWVNRFSSLRTQGKAGGEGE